MNKTQARAWLKRIREDVRDAERALKDDNWEAVRGYMEDASGSAGEVVTAIDERVDA